MMSLDSVENSVVISKVRELVREERRLTDEILIHLREIERRRLHCELGYSSLHEFMVRELGYSDGAAFRRIASMRLIQAVPSVQEMIVQGDLSLSTASTIQSFFQAEKRVRDKSYSGEEKSGIVESLKGKSKRECEQVLAELSPQAVPKEKERSVGEKQTQIQFIASRELMAKLERVRNRLPHSHSKLSYAELFEKMADQVLERLEPAKPRAAKQAASPEKLVAEKVEKPTRYIPAHVRRAVWHRDRGRCTFVHTATARRCESRRVEYDHRIPYAHGGPATYENLRLRCRAHNQLAAIEVFGRGHIAAFVPSLR